MLPSTILVTNRTNIRYFCGFSGTAGHLVLQRKGGALFTDARYHLVAQSVLPKGFSLIDITNGFEAPWKEFLEKYRVKKLGIEGGSMSLELWNRLKKISPNVELSDIGKALDQKRIIKRPEELRSLAKAQIITDKILSKLKKWLAVGVSEKAIAWKIEVLAHNLGAEDISFPPIIGINEHSASPHHQNTDRRLKKGDLVLIDMGVVYRGYCSDMTRMIFTKAPTNEQKTVYECVKKAQEKAEKALYAGITGEKADSIAREVIVRAGHEKHFGHSLGHGVGLDIHELPNLSQKYPEKIPEGAVVTVEPGIYLPEKFGVRLEDMVVVEKDGARNLTKSPKDIQACRIYL